MKKLIYRRRRGHPEASEASHSRTLPSPQPKAEAALTPTCSPSSAAHVKKGNEPCKTAVNSTPSPLHPTDDSGLRPSPQGSDIKDGGRCSGASARQDDFENEAHSKRDYWQLAVENLQKKEPKSKELLTTVQKAAAEAGTDFTEQLILDTNKSREDLMSRQWKVTLAGRQMIVREQLDKILRAVQVFRGLGNPVANIDPVHAGLPWAGLCLLIQVRGSFNFAAIVDSDIHKLSTSYSEQYEAIVAGAEEIATIISRYREIEALYVSHDGTSLKEAFESNLIALYEQILNYQLKAVYFYRRNTFSTPHTESSIRCWRWRS